MALWHFGTLQHEDSRLAIDRRRRARLPGVFHFFYQTVLLQSSDLAVDSPVATQVEAAHHVVVRELFRQSAERIGTNGRKYSEKIVKIIVEIFGSFKIFS